MSQAHLITPRNMLSSSVKGRGGICGEDVQGKMDACVAGCLRHIDRAKEIRANTAAWVEQSKDVPHQCLMLLWLRLLLIEKQAQKFGMEVHQRQEV